jgi:hypothetical protein
MDVEHLGTEAGNVCFETLELDSSDRPTFVAMVVADISIAHAARRTIIYHLMNDNSEGQRQTSSDRIPLVRGRPTGGQ